MRASLLEGAAALAGVAVRPTTLSLDGEALCLDEDLAKGQPEAFVIGDEFAIVRADGSLHLQLDPGWTRELLGGGWGTIHPLARYMAGAVPPQSLIVYAPRDEDELGVAARIVEAAHGFAVGRFDELILPDTRW